MEELAGIALTLLAAALVINLVQGGWQGVRDWVAAKLTGNPKGIQTQEVSK